MYRHQHTTTICKHAKELFHGYCDLIVLLVEKGKRENVSTVMCTDIHSPIGILTYIYMKKITHTFSHTHTHTHVKQTKTLKNAHTHKHTQNQHQYIGKHKGNSIHKCIYNEEY